ncbi:MAG: hypothetical protein ABFD54_07100 [Armatimonadota bacterium]|nr:hypothetical protein [bacterium]
MQAVNLIGANRKQWASDAGRAWVALLTRAIPYALVSSCFAVYISTLTSAYTYDSIAYATQIREYVAMSKPGWLFHPHHLLYNPLGYYSWKLLSWFGLSVDPLKSLQYMNALFGALGVVLIYEILRRGGLCVSRTCTTEKGTGVFPALTAALIMSTAYGYWTCATDGRVNIPALIGVMLVAGLGWGMLSLPSIKQAIALAAVTILAVLLHQSNGLLVFAGLGSVLISDASWRQRLQLSLIYISVFILGIAGAYLGVGVFIKGARSISELQAWMLAYAHDGRWWSFNIQENLQQDLHALTRVFITTESPWGAKLSFVILAALIGVLAYVALRFVYRYRGINHSSQKSAILAIIAVPYAAFFTIWNPGYFVFWLPTGLALVMWFAMAVSEMRPRWNYALSIIGLLWVAAALTINVPMISYRIHRAHNPNLTICDALKKHTHAGDMVLITGTYLQPTATMSYLEVYMPYFTRVSVKNTLGECKYWHGNIRQTVYSLRGVIQNRINNGHQVFILKEFLSVDTWNKLQQRYSNANGMQNSILLGYKLQPITHAGELLAYRLVPYKTL